MTPSRSHLLAVLSLVLAACGPASQSEPFQPSRGVSTLATAAPLAKARSGHTATLLADGRVLVAGGGGLGGVLNSAEVYDPATGTWAPTGSLVTGRSGHTATLLSDGRVLVVGGGSFGGSLTCEVYDPATGTWAATGSLAVLRQNYAAAPLADGKVLVVGGEGASAYLASAELY